MRRSLPALLIALSLCAGLAPRAGAVFIKTQMDRIDMEPLFDSRYFLNLLSFADPLAWQDLWKSTDNGYRINAASLDCCQLFLEQDLRFKRRLTDGLSFRYGLVQQEDKDAQEFHQWIELEQALGLGFSVSLFGEPTFRKEDSDIGLGASYRNAHGFSIGVRRTFVDFNFNQRGSTTQRYERLPYSDLFVVEHPAAGGSVSAALELDYPLRRDIPDEKRLFSYRRTTATAAWRQAPGDGLRSRAEYSYQFQEKGDRFTPDPLAKSLDSRRQVHRAFVAVEGPVTDRDRIEAGHVLLERAARTDNAGALRQAGAFYRRWEAQPYARWRRRALAWLETEAAAFFSFGEDRRRAPASSHASLIESKLGLGADFIFGGSGRIQLYPTFQLDTPRHPWGGGNVRAMFLF